MAISITVPRLGWNMEQGTFLGWLKEDGAAVRAGDMLFRLESDKATEEIECHDSGTLRIAADGPREGDTVDVGAVIGYLLQAGEAFTPGVPGEGRKFHPPGVPGEGRKPIPPSPGTRGEGPGVRAEQYASPRARRVAAELGVDWTTLKGSGRTGRIREKDVRAAVPSLNSVRRASVEHLLKSIRSTIPVTLTTTADATSIVEIRQLYKRISASEPIPGVTDFLVKHTAVALQKHPLLAARWIDDRLVMPDALHIGIAVDTDAGLLVPVIHHAATLSLDQLAARSRDLIERARQGKLTTKEMQGGVFTLTNLGMYGIDAFTPIINYPQCAILGVGRIQRVPVFVDDRVEARHQITLSLTFDHRLVDGAPAARFLQTLTQGIEKIVED